MRIYLDVCCLNRPFDDQTQDRIRLEAEAILLILSRLQAETWKWLSSEVVVDEIEQTPQPKRRKQVSLLASHAHEWVTLTKSDVARAIHLETVGFGGMDALHLACAESSKADVFLTTNDKLVRNAEQHSQKMKVDVANPLGWLVTQQETKA